MAHINFLAQGEERYYFYFLLLSWGYWATFCCCDYVCCCHCAPMLCHFLLNCICPKGNRTSWHRLNLSQVGLSARGPNHWGQTGLLTSNVSDLTPLVNRTTPQEHCTNETAAWLETAGVKAEECINNRWDENKPNSSDKQRPAHSCKNCIW